MIDKPPAVGIIAWRALALAVKDNPARWNDWQTDTRKARRAPIIAAESLEALNAQ